MNKFSLALLGLAVLISVNPANCASNFSYSAPNAYSNAQDSLQGNVTYVPAGSTAKIMLQSDLDSSTATTGSSVSATLAEDFIYNNTTVASKGSVLTGTVVTAKKGGFGNKNGQLQVVFNNITTSQGYNIPVNAVFKTDDNTGILKGGTTADSAKDYAKDTIIGAGAGAALGTAMGALSSGSVGKGAIYGTALGGGLGLAKGVATKGDNISVPAGSYMEVYFTQPITLAAPTEYTYDY